MSSGAGESVEDSARQRLKRAIERIPREAGGKKAIAARADVERSTLYNFLNDPASAKEETVAALDMAVSSLRLEVIRRREKERVADWLEWIAGLMREGDLPGFAGEGDELRDAFDAGLKAVDVAALSDKPESVAEDGDGDGAGEADAENG